MNISALELVAGVSGLGGILALFYFSLLYRAQKNAPGNRVTESEKRRIHIRKQTGIICSSIVTLFCLALFIYVNSSAFSKAATVEPQVDPAIPIVTKKDTVLIEPEFDVVQSADNSPNTTFTKEGTSRVKQEAKNSAGTKFNQNDSAKKRTD